MSRPVDVEVLLLGLRDGHLVAEVRRSPLSDASPDKAALDLAGAAVLSHSTSWRDDGGVLVLTYAVVTAQAQGLPVLEPSVVCSTDPRRPSPPALHGHHVVAHAVRHLSDLLHRDPVVAAALVDLPQLVAAVRDAASTMPVAPHREAHDLARSTRQPA